MPAPWNFTKQAIPSRRDDRKLLASWSFRAFCEIYLPHAFHGPWCAFHLSLIEALESDADRICAIGWRESGKTAVASTAYALWRAVCKSGRYLILGQTNMKLCSMDLRSVRLECEQNELLRYDWGDETAKPGDELIGRTWQETSISIRKPNTSGRRNQECLIMCATPGTAIMGANVGFIRPDEALLMDPERVNSKRMADPEQRRQFAEWLEGDLMGAVTWRIVMCANLTNEDSYAGRLVEGLPFEHPDGSTYGERNDEKAYRPKQARWRRQKWQVHLPDGTPVWDGYKTDKTRADGTPVWVGWPAQRIAEKKAEVTADIWAAHYMSSPLLDVLRVFPAGSLSITYGPCAPRNGAEARTWWPGMPIVAAMDLAFSAKARRDETTLAVMGHHLAEGWYGVLAVKHTRANGLAERRTLVFAQWAIWRWERMGVEVQGAQIDFLSSLREEMAHHCQACGARALQSGRCPADDETPATAHHEIGIFFRTDEILQPGHITKFERIKEMEPRFRPGHCRLAGDQTEIRDTLESYTELSAHDDVPDVIEMAYQVARKTRVAEPPVARLTPTAQAQGDWLARREEARERVMARRAAGSRWQR